MKRVSIIVSLCLALALLVSGPAQAAEVTLTTACNQPEDYPTVQGLRYMDQYLQRLTDGEVELDIYPHAELGEEAETIEMTQAGAIDINRVSVAPVTGIAPVLEVFALPYVFEDEMHMHNVLDSEVGEDLSTHEELIDSGVRALTWYDAGQRSVYSAERPVYSPEDLEGQTIRVQPADVMVDAMEALGASATVMEFGEVYSALDTGVIDAAENNWPSLYATGHYEVVDYYSIGAHARLPEPVLINEDTYNELSEEHREALIKAAEASKHYQRARWRAMAEEAEQQVREAGVEINEVDDITEFQEKVEPVYDEYVTDEMQPYLDRIEELAQ